MGSQVRSAHSARLVTVRERTLQELPSLPQESLATLAPNPPSVGLQCRGVNAQRLTLPKTFLGQHLQHSGEDLLVSLQVDPPANLAEAGVVGRGLLDLVPQELQQRPRVVTPPGDPTLGVDALEATDQQHAEVYPRRDAGTPEIVVIGLPAETLDQRVESVLGQELVQLAVEGCPGASGMSVIATQSSC